MVIAERRLMRHKSAAKEEPARCQHFVSVICHIYIHFIDISSWTVNPEIMLLRIPHCSVHFFQKRKIILSGPLLQGADEVLVCLNVFVSFNQNLLG